MSRTSSLFDVYPAFTELTHKIDSINTAQLAKSFTTLADTFRHTPNSVRNVLRGLSRSPTRSPRATRRCAPCSRGPTTSPASWPPATPQLQKILSDGGLLLDELQRPPRRDPLAAGQHHDAVDPARGTGPRQPEDDRPAARHPGPDPEAAQQQPGQPRPRAGAARPVLPRVHQHASATAAGSTTTSATSAWPARSRSGSAFREPQGNGGVQLMAKLPKKITNVVVVVVLAAIVAGAAVYFVAQRAGDQEAVRAVRLGGRRLRRHAGQDPRHRRRPGHQGVPERARSST